MTEEKVRSYRLHEQTGEVSEYEGRLVIKLAKDYRPVEITSKRRPSLEITCSRRPSIVIERTKKEK
jgi:hypothetical protein